ncbi:hypothetical protein Tco_1400000 [Tanacetum coccineum]
MLFFHWVVLEICLQTLLTISTLLSSSDSDIEDAFSSTNTPDYTPASPDYSSASSRNTSSDPSENLSNDLLASLAISPFYDDPYMKVMQAYNATSKKSPIPPPRAPIAPPTVLPPSLVLPPSPLFDPRDFFLPEEILPPQKQAHFLSSSSTDFSAPLKNELPLERIEHMEDKIEGLGNDRVIIQISTIEMIIEDIQVRHRSDMKSLLDKIHELKNHKGGPPNY